MNAEYDDADRGELRNADQGVARFPASSLPAKG
jgi:hypothetical protein